MPPIEARRPRLWITVPRDFRARTASPFEEKGTLRLERTGGGQVVAGYVQAAAWMQRLLPSEGSAASARSATSMGSRYSLRLAEGPERKGPCERNFYRRGRRPWLTHDARQAHAARSRTRRDRSLNASPSHLASRNLATFRRLAPRQRARGPCPPTCCDRRQLSLTCRCWSICRGHQAVGGSQCFSLDARVRDTRGEQKHARRRFVRTLGRGLIDERG